MPLLNPDKGPILVTGAAGFIGANVCRNLLEKGCTVVGVDNLNDYYDVALKHHRLEALHQHADFQFQQLELADQAAVIHLFEEFQFGVLIHLAAQAGVRYSIQNPNAYIQSNVVGFQNILEGCRLHRPEHLVFASSSSVYGNSKKPCSPRPMPRMTL